MKTELVRVVFALSVLAHCCLLVSCDFHTRRQGRIIDHRQIESERAPIFRRLPPHTQPIEKLEREV